MKRLFPGTVIIFSLLISNLSAQDIDNNHFFVSESEGDTIRFGLMLPDSYRQDSKNRYPVIYFLHGHNGRYNDNASQGMALFLHSKAREGIIPECIVVFPNGEEGFWCNHCDGSPLLEKTIVESLAPYIEEEYNTNPKETIIAGWSSGGMGALTLFARNPELFNSAISLDGPIISWEQFCAFQGKRTDVICDSLYYYRYCSPFWSLSNNQSAFTNTSNPSIFLTSSFFTPYYQKILYTLDQAGISFTHSQVNCQHDLSCILLAVEEELVEFLESRLRN